MSGDASEAGEDAVDRIIEQWRDERPDLDPSAKEITGRVVRLASIFQKRFGEAFSELGLSEGDYGLLVALRRAGDPFELTPTELARARMMTSGGMTALIDRLEQRDLLQRRPNPADRRGSIVGLTSAGRELVDRAMDIHTKVEHDLVADLEGETRNQLTSLLRTLLRRADVIGH